MKLDSPKLQRGCQGVGRWLENRRKSCIINRLWPTAGRRQDPHDSSHFGPSAAELTALPWAQVMKNLFIPLAALVVVSALAPAAYSQEPSRRIVPLMDEWRTVLDDPAAAADPNFNDTHWQSISLPHNWEDYQGYRQLTHGNLHGTAWYRRTFTPNSADKGRRFFVEFEGVGSYAKVFLNGTQVGAHAGGRTCFSCDITDDLRFDEANILAVRADHPAKIDDLPYVCGGCWGSPNTEGSQPLGIFRPVRLVVTDSIRVEPFGVQVWTPEISVERAVVKIATEVKNYGAWPREVTVRSEVVDADGHVLAHVDSTVEVAPGALETVEQTCPPITMPHLWSLDDPYLHHIRTTLVDDEAPLDELSTRFGMRWIEWPVGSVGAGDTADRTIDPEKLAEVPSEANDFFTTRLGPADADVRVVGPVRVSIPTCDAQSATVRVVTTLKNFSGEPKQVLVTSFLRNFNGTKFVYSLDTPLAVEPGESREVVQESPTINFPELWSPENPYLHVVETTLQHPENAHDDEKAVIYDRAETSFGIHATTELANKGDAYAAPAADKSGKPAPPRPFLLNGKPVFLNGTCEYEHLLGNDHAFTDEQIRARMLQVKAAGFNAFRDAHHPHNLKYLELCDELGLVCWTQIGAHVYFDSEPFRENYRQAAREWVRERRNSPSIVLWGLQNESSLPEVFARELTEIIRELDPTTSSQRKTATCNGGAGSDWDVPQNWLGTYLGNVNDYGDEAVRQKLVGEYGQWRTLGLHQDGDWQENWAENQMLGREIPEELFVYCLETRIRQAEERRDQFCGHFQWIFNTHANPGRDETNCRDGLPPNDVGVVNYKGLIASWGEPVDAYYMFRANYTPPDREPMVYIHSHTWPNRFDGPGEKSNLVVYSNCDEVELFNDYRTASLGVKKRGPRGTHFEWDSVPVNHNVLYAEGRVNGKPVASDIILLDNLPPAPAWQAHAAADADNTAAAAGEYLYRINCGGEDYTDSHGNRWQDDSHDSSWAQEYENLDPRYASVGRTHDPIAGTQDDELLQTYRYGRHKLGYRFEVPHGRYAVELYFVEPWYGTGGGLDCTAWRLFDVAVNGQTVLDDLDVWKEAGHDAALKKVVEIDVTDGALEVSFPEVKSYQAVISAIAVRRATESDHP